MHQTLKHVLLLLLWEISAGNLFAQSIQHRDIITDRMNRLIYIPFKIEDQRRLIYDYDIQVFYSQDAGQSYKGPLEHISGHVGEGVLAGEEKLIIWDYLKDDPHFYGVNLRFKIRATFQKSVLNLKGPEGAFYSLLIPGWGNSKVRFLKHKANWLYLTLPTYALIGGGIYLNRESKRNYEAYLQANSFEEANPLFEKADRQKTWGRVCLIGGSLLWAGDILQTALRGIKNEREKQNILDKNQAIEPKITWSLEPSGFPFGGKLIAKF